MKRIVLACSGDPETLAIPRLRDRYGAEVVAAIVDVGQDGVDVLRGRALSAGAAQVHVIDAREEFASRYVLRALNAGAFEGGHAALEDSLARALVAGKLVDLAEAEQAAAIAHGGEHESFLRIVSGLNPEMPVIACVVESRTSVSEEDTPARADTGCPDGAVFIELEFQQGLPVAVNGVDMSLPDLMTSVTLITGIPAAAVLHRAHGELQRLVTMKEAAGFSRAVGVEYRNAVLDGLWFTPLREALDAYVGKLQERVTGTIRLHLLEGELSVVDRQSVNATNSVDSVDIPVNDPPSPALVR